MRNIKKIIVAIFILGSATAAFADCFDQCMSIKDCWHRGEGYSSFCGSAEVNCEMSCRDKQSTRGSYGAIAYSAKDESYGFSDSQNSQREAEDLAMGYCQQYGTGCRAMVWFKNSCGAVASNGKKTGWGHGDTEEAAQKKALKSCRKKNCEIKVSHCT